MGVLRNMKYENGGNQRSRAAPQIRRVLSRPKNDRFWRVFYPIPPIFFAFSPFPRTYKTNFAKKIRSGLHFLAAVEAQSFCLNSGRVATAYSTDKYKYQNHENKSQLSRAIYYGTPGGPKSVIFATIDLDPLYFEVGIFLGPPDPPYMSKNAQMCYF